MENSKYKEYGPLLRIASADSQSFARQIREAYGIEFWLSQARWGNTSEPDIVSLESIVVPPQQRGKGIGVAVMGEFIHWANKNKLILGLTPSSDFGGNVSKLRTFYKKFGFVPNLGRNKDYRTRDVFIRYPR